MAKRAMARGGGRSGRGGHGGGSGRGGSKKAKPAKGDAEAAETRATFFGRSGDDGDEEISSDSDAEMDEAPKGRTHDGESEDEDVDGEERETVEEKQLRLARAYLQEAREADRAMRAKKAPRRRMQGDEGGGSDEDKANLDEDEDSDEYERLGVALRLAREREAGKAFEAVCARLAETNFDGDDAARRAVRLSGHRGPVTCVALSERAGHVFSGSKDNGVLQHDLATGARLRTFLPRWPLLAHEVVEDARSTFTQKSRGVGSETRAEHSGGATVAPRQSREAEVLCLAASPDGRYLACGGRDSLVHVWDLRVARDQPALSLRGHKGAVTCLAFRDDVFGAADAADPFDGDEADGGADDRRATFFSGGDDCTLKHWDAASGAYVESLFGHEGGVRCVDCGYDERPLSGAGDRSVRAWKLRDETHLVYRASAGASGLGRSVDAVRALDRDRFATAGDDGSLALWSAKRKKPLTTVKSAHGHGAAAQQLESAQEEDTAQPARWLTALGAPRGSDLLLSGSCDGFVRLWRVSPPDAPKPSLERFAQVPALGFVNAIVVSRAAAFVACAVSHEHRLGRWERVKRASNSVLLFPLLNSAAQAD